MTHGCTRFQDLFPTTSEAVSVRTEAILRNYVRQREVEIFMPKNANTGSREFKFWLTFYLSIAKLVFLELSEEFANFFIFPD